MITKPMTHLPSVQEEIQEEALADIFECFEKGLKTMDKVGPLLDEKVEPGVIRLLEKKGLISIGSGQIRFSPEAEKLAVNVIRRKRLAERLLKDVLNVRDEIIDAAACQWEHTLSGEVTSSICTLLGHPTHSPFDLPIPPGDCCKNEAKSPTPIISSLEDMSQGEKAKIVYLLVKQKPELNRLLSMGLTPGSLVEVIQRYPTYVVECGQSQLAFDASIASAIFVHPLQDEVQHG